MTIQVKVRDASQKELAEAKKRKEKRDSKPVENPNN